MNTKRWANDILTESESLGDSSPRVQNNCKENTKKEREQTKSPQSTVSISDTIKPSETAISSGYLLMIFLNFPDVKDMILKVHLSCSQELEHLFHFL